SDFALGQQLINVCTNGESLSRAFGPTSPGGSCTITVIYNGSGALNVPETAALTINDTSISPPGTTQSVTLNATTVPTEPQLVVNPGAGLNFGAIAENAPSAQLAAEVTNNGSGPLSISSINLAGPNAADFHIASQSPACSSAITLQQCFVSVYFQPSATGSESAMLQIASNDPLTPLAQVQLTGSGGTAPGPPAGLPFLVSVNNGAPPSPANNGTGASAVSSGGQFVAFLGGGGSLTGNMPGPSSAVEGASGLYLRNTCAGPDAGPSCAALTQFIAYGPVSGPASNGGGACLNQQQTQTQGATNPHISADGRYVAFNDDACPPSSANALPVGPGPIFLRDTQANGGAGATTAVLGASGNPIGSQFAMSSDARYFAYPSPPGSPGQTEISETDTQTPSTILVSQSTNGTADGGIALSLPSISPDGRYVAFASDFDDVNGAAGNGFVQTYLRDTCLGAPSGCTPSTILISADGSGNPATGGSSGGDFNLGGSATPGTAVSSGGRYVAFTSNASALPQPPNRQTGDPYPVEVYLRDTCIGAPSGCMPTTTLLSLAAGGTTPSNDSVGPQISNDGRIITFYNQGQLFGTAPFDALYSFDTCLSNGIAVGGGCQAGLKGVISATISGTMTNLVQTSVQYSLDASGQFATYQGPPDGCTACFQIWENSAGGSLANGANAVTVPLISLTPSTTSPAASAPVDFTIVATNDGATPVSDVTVTDSITSNGSFGTPLPAGCSLTSSILVTCDLGPLSAGNSASVAIPVNAPSAGGATLTDSATVSTGSQTNLALQTSLSSTVTVPAFTIVPAATTFTCYLDEPFSQTFT
ncbi:MAG: choice-of-anchor D domain-containing protein, partial [Terriglobales bacterium]